MPSLIYIFLFEHETDKVLKDLRNFVIVFEKVFEHRDVSHNKYEGALKLMTVLRMKSLKQFFLNV